MYKWTNVENGKWYLGIKKDLLPEHGGEPYWTSSENEEFVNGFRRRFAKRKHASVCPDVESLF